MKLQCSLKKLLRGTDCLRQIGCCIPASRIIAQVCVPFVITALPWHRAEE